ncbi:amidohydrolase [Tenacibaculum caenipelagi]|uniref:amidohydrolase n=1 Tax=Tenacibaculum caenipelagi TaxID=1325435 RepID=UPI001FB6A5D2|nr:amidohydrolase [Tenacibaculum caenipelagi]
METLKNSLEEFRKELHQYPEVSGKEYETQKRIKAYLTKNTSCKVVEVASTGVIAIFEGKKAGKTVMLRADIDALPIQEKNTFQHQSINKKISHKCGHDGHTTIMIGVANMLTKHPIEEGKVLLLFQPSEENGKGAAAVLKDPFFKKIKIDFVFALHNLPGFAKHEIVVKNKTFTSNVKSVVIQLSGKTAHAAEPEKGYNPSNAIAEILIFAELESKNFPESQDFLLVTPIYITMGEKAYGISAGYGEVHLTLRGWDTNLMEEKREKLEELINQLEKKHSLVIKTSWFEEFYSNKNDEEAVSIIKKSAEQNKLSVNNIKTPFKWGEDFGLFTQKYKGAMFGLGAGESIPALHNPDYDFPNDIIMTGVQLFHSIVKEVLKS